MNYKKQGKRNRKKGKKFELRVREDLEKQGWIVSKWSNNVSKPFQIDIGEWQRGLEPAKSQYNPFFKRIIGEGSGFPDFIAFKKYGIIDDKIGWVYEIIGVEAKSGKYLDKEEKEKCRWLINNKIFQKILIAFKGKKRGEIIYTEYLDKPYTE